MLEIIISGAENLQERLRAVGPKLQNSLQEAMQRITLEGQLGTQAKLENVVLHHRSGNLVRNITRDVHTEGETVVGTVGIGRNAWYGKLHEQGFQGSGARKRLLHPPHLITRKDGTKAMTGSSYPINIPARPFLIPTLREMESRARNYIELAIRKAIA